MNDVLLDQWSFLALAFSKPVNPPEALYLQTLNAKQGIARGDRPLAPVWLP
jgi:hypothetical protein